MNQPPPSSPTPPPSVLESIYRHLPMIIVVLGSDGKVLYANPAAIYATGYAEAEIVGQNFWSLLFPGKLFTQVPKFISASHPVSILARDVAMVLRAKDGQERVIAWSRITQDSATVLFGNDLTDRLSSTDVQNGRMDIPEPASFGANVGNGGTIEGEIITPIAISPPILPGDGANGGGAAIQQVHDFLINIEERVGALETAFSMGELANLAGIAASLRTGAHACGLLDFSTRAEQLHAAAAKGAIEQVSSLVQQIVLMVRPDHEG